MKIYDPTEQTTDSNPLPKHTPSNEFFKGDPDKGGTKVNTIYDLLKASGEVEKIENMGGSITPTHDINLLKEVREKEYRKAAVKLHAEYIYQNSQPTKKDFVYHYLSWLQDELTRNCDGWIKKNWTCNKTLDNFLSSLLKLPVIIVERGKIV